MKVEDLDGKEVMILGFGGVILTAIVILASIYVGHSITLTSSVPQPVHVSSAPANVTVAVPQQAAPKVEVSAPRIDVHVPTAAAPTINVTTPPATVTVVEREKEKEKESKPAPAPTTTPKAETKTVPASLETKERSEAKAEVIDIDSLYANAERYIESYCKKTGLDPIAEQSKWDAAWKGRVATAVNDGGTEQSLMDRTIVDSRACFDLNAPPEKVVEGCRLMLRIRDAKLAMLDAMKNALTRDNLIKTIAFLQTGAK